MKYLVTAQEMKKYDANTIEKVGISGMVLMERAALFVLKFLLEKYEQPKLQEQRVLIMVGVGNNGGDGLALVRLLADIKVPVMVCVVGDVNKASEQWKQQRAILENYSVSFGDIDVNVEYNILIDALFGVGLSRPVEGIYAEAITHFNACRGYKIALDIPSGIHSDNGSVLGVAVKADVTLTFGFVKRGLYMFPGCEYTGDVLLDSVGITEKGFCGEAPTMFSYDEPMLELMPARRIDGNKGTFGKVLLIAGSKNMAGAAILAARAAYCIGAGMVKVLTPSENRIILQETIPEALLGDYDDIEESLLWADVVAIGPGLGQTEAAKQILEQVVRKSNLPLIIDADGLNLLAKDSILQTEIRNQGQNRTVILTPHVGELARLTKKDIASLKGDLPSSAMNLSKDLHAIVVAKDARTYICSEQHPICVNITGNNGMATAGSGDVLTGMIAGLFAQKRDGFYAACVGTYIHGCCGDRASISKGKYACMAGDIVTALSNIGE